MSLKATEVKTATAHALTIIAREKGADVEIAISGAMSGRGISAICVELLAVIEQHKRPGDPVEAVEAVRRAKEMLAEAFNYDPARITGERHSSRGTLQ